MIVLKKREPFFFVVILFLFSLFQSSTFAEKKLYVVYLGGHAHGPEPTQADFDGAKDSHHELLGSLLGSKESAKNAIISSYTKHINGFGAALEEEEAEALSKHPDVLSVFEDKGIELHTTRSWKFLGLESNGVVPDKSLWKKARFGEDIIIGNIDSGVWPESESFSDEGMGPIPSKWKGFCQNDTEDGVPCNRKLIGARYFNKGYEFGFGQLPPNSIFHSARDYEGHGTHTLSTAGGNFVAGANVFGYNSGTVKGGSPKARVAAYKVFWPPVDGRSVTNHDIMDAFDAAIHDGVDILTVSLGPPPMDYFRDSVSIGALHAIQKGIVVVTSAGNDGPVDGSVTNVAPWTLTVGASTIDRGFINYVKLGGTKRLIKGYSAIHQSLPSKYYPLIAGADAKVANAPTSAAEFCVPGSLDLMKVDGKIVVCKKADQEGAVSMTLVTNVQPELSINENEIRRHDIPSGHIGINYTDGLAIFSYINSTESPTAAITWLEGARVGIKPAPYMAPFSSKGPNTITPEILKPDITAPGVSILAAYPLSTEGTSSKRTLRFNFESGTSMSCPHVAGVAGLLKTLYPNWSPAAIRSAIMTSASTEANDGQPLLDSSYVMATPFSYGAGHMRPNRAKRPGLVYDLTEKDYFNFLCGIGYSETIIVQLTGQQYKCPESYSLMDFNYPSITVPKLSGSITATRTVKNVGGPSTYNVSVLEPEGISVTVKPDTLKFSEIGEEKKFYVTFEAKKAGAARDYAFGSLKWSDGKHNVRSQIVVKAA